MANVLYTASLNSSYIGKKQRTRHQHRIPNATLLYIASLNIVSFQQSFHSFVLMRLLLATAGGRQKRQNWKGTSDKHWRRSWRSNHRAKDSPHRRGRRRSSLLAIVVVVIVIVSEIFNRDPCREISSGRDPPLLAPKKCIWCMKR